MNIILQALVGSQAHGLAGPTSDEDYRGVFVTPTAELLVIGGSTKATSWNEGTVDDVNWEVGHYCFLATKCNPAILETLRSPQVQADVWGRELMELFPAFWNSRGVHAAFKGYGHNQRKKLLDDKDKRANKYACAYLRVLYNAWQLLTTGNFTVDITKTEVYEQCRRFKAGEFSLGEVIQTCHVWEGLVDQAFERNPNKQTDLAAVNDYLLRLRRAYF